jgi:hypothetical protein
MEYPTLFTTTGNGMKRYWKISVVDEGNTSVIIREYGKYQGKPIINRKVISQAKSRGTVHEQALFEAENDWKNMQHKKGYGGDCAPPITPPTTGLRNNPHEPSDTSRNKEDTVGAPALRNIEDNKDGDDAGDVGGYGGASPPHGDVGGYGEGGYGGAPPPQFLPMLANKFTERKKYVVYPCLSQPKLDGVRHTARGVKTSTREGDKGEPEVPPVILRTRNDTEVPFFDHIKQAIARLNLPTNVILDGEFYSLKIPFKTLNGYCNRKKLDGKTGYLSIPKDDLDSIHYYIFDCYFTDQPQMPFEKRYQFLTRLSLLEPLKLVPCTPVQQESEIHRLHDQFVTDGFEGIMIRNSQSPYKIKDRSNDLLKFKHFQDAEFTIVGANTPSNGKEEGCIIWLLQLPNSQLTFTCRPRDTYEGRKEDWSEFQRNPQQFIGKLYTVRFQETYDNGIPRFPAGIAIRE